MSEVSRTTVNSSPHAPVEIVSVHSPTPTLISSSALTSPNEVIAAGTTLVDNSNKKMSSFSSYLAPFVIRRVVACFLTVAMCVKWTSSRPAPPNDKWFLWHPILMSLAYVASMPESIFLVHTMKRKGLLSHIGTGAGSVAEKNSNTSISPTERKRLRYLHMICAMVMNVASLGGYVAIFMSKRNGKRPHLTSWHGQIGFLSTVCVVLQVVVGCFIYWPQPWVKGGTRALLWKVHRWAAIGVLLLGAWAFWLGLVSNFAVRAFTAPNIEVVKDASHALIFGNGGGEILRHFCGFSCLLFTASAYFLE